MLIDGNTIEIGSTLNERIFSYLSPNSTVSFTGTVALDLADDSQADSARVLSSRS